MHGVQLAARRGAAGTAHRLATRSSGRAWGRGSPTAWAPRIATCPASSPSARRSRTAGSTTTRSAFLPAAYQGTPLGNAGTPSDQRDDAVHQGNDAAGPAAAGTRPARRAGPRARWPRPAPIRRSKAASSRSSWRSGCRRRRPSVQDMSKETRGDAEALRHRRPGRPTNFGRQCLMARRFAEARRALRPVSRTATSGTSTANLQGRPREATPARSTSRSPACSRDLKARGLLDDTLVLWGGEFGRTPTAEGNDGRDHNPHGFTMWLAGGGVKRGLSLRRHRRVRLLRRRGQGPRPRPARDDPAPAGPRPHRLTYRTPAATSA